MVPTVVRIFTARPETLYVAAKLTLSFPVRRKNHKLSKRRILCRCHYGSSLGSLGAFLGSHQTSISLTPRSLSPKSPVLKSHRSLNNQELLKHIAGKVILSPVLILSRLLKVFLNLDTTWQEPAAFDISHRHNHVRPKPEPYFKPDS